MIAEAIGIGIIISFLCAERAGLYAGGLITPGYIAFFGAQPLRIAATFLVAICTYAVVLLLSQVIIIYGRRRFMAAVIIGFCIGWIVKTFVLNLMPVEEDLRVIGYIIPGLVANDMIKQGIWRTMLAIAIVAMLVRLILFIRIGG